MRLKIFSGDSFKNRLKEKFWIFILLAIGFFMVFPVQEFVRLGHWKAMEYSEGMLLKAYRNMWNGSFAYTGLIVTAAAAFFNALDGFWYLYSAPKVDFYHSLPVKRGQNFREKSILGTLLFTAAYLTMEIIALIAGMAQGYFSTTVFTGAVKGFLLHLLIYWLLYFSLVLAICITGNLLAGFLAMVGICCYGSALGILIFACQNLFYVTSSMSLLNGVAELLVKFGSPVSLAVMLAENSGQAGKGRVIAAAIFMLLAMAGCAYLAYVKRKCEKTGSSVVYGFLEPCFCFLIVIPCAIGMGDVFLLIAAEHSSKWWIFGILAGLLLSYALLQMIFRMDVHGLLTHKIQFLVLCGCVAVCAWMLKVDVFHYNEYLPSRNSLADIQMNLDIFGGWQISQDVSVDDSGKYVLGYNNGNTYVYNGEESMGASERVYEIMKNIIASQKEAGKTGTYVDVTYEKKFGMHISRRYVISPEDAKDLLLAYYEQESRKETMYQAFMIEPEYLETIGYYCSQSFGNKWLEGNEAQELLAAFRQDVEEASAEELTAVPCAGITLTYDLPVSDMGGKIIRSKGETELYSASYYIYPTFTRTIAILKQKGCPVSVKDADIKCVNVVYAGTDSEEDWQNSEVMEITDHKEIEELKQGMVLDILCPGWVETEEGVSLDVYKEDDKNGENESYVLLKDQVPQFIQEGKEKFQEGLDTVIVYETEETE